MTPDPIRLAPDPLVAQAAWRFPSRSAPGRTYDVALAPDGTFSCECWPFLKVDECAHVAAAERLMRREAARTERQAELDSRKGCRHPLTVDEDCDLGTGRLLRRCVGCGYSYDRGAWRRRTRDEIQARHRLPSSPWSAAERAGDTE